MENKLDILQKKIGAEIKKLRLESGFSSYEVFADKNELSRIQYFKMEKGTNFTLKSLNRVLDIHEISIINFFHKLDKDSKKTIDSKGSDRLKTIIERSGMSKLEFSKLIGLTNSNKINSILNGQSNIKAKVAYLINKKFPELSFRWILKGEGEMI
ncbi:MAG: helix-turn-helix transcriptional regulator [Flavobacteriaceae bacterium]|nr:helix-turn-helix transcriptional regulator [Flavobacteriaceae bacterium]